MSNINIRLDLENMLGPKTELPLETMSYIELKVVYSIYSNSKNLLSLPKHQEEFIIKYGKGNRDYVVEQVHKVDPGVLFRLMTSAKDKETQAGYEADLVIQQGTEVEVCENYTIIKDCFREPPTPAAVEDASKTFTLWDSQLVHHRKLNKEARTKAVTDEVKNSSQIYSRARPMVSVEAKSFGIKPKIIQEIMEVVKVTISSEGKTCIVPNSISLPTDKAVYDLSTFSVFTAKALSTAFSKHLPTVKTKADLRVLLEAAPVGDVMVLYNYLVPTIPRYAKGDRECLIVDAQAVLGSKGSRKKVATRLLAVDITTNGFKKCPKPFVKIQKMNVIARKEGRDSLVCAMFDGLPLKDTRAIVNVLHDLPEKLDYDVVFLETKNTAFAQVVLGRVKAYKRENLIKRKTLVVHTGTTALFADTASKIMNEKGIILVDAIVGRHDFEWAKYKELSYLIYLCSPSKVTQQSLLSTMCSIATKNDVARVNNFHELKGLKVDTVCVRHILSMWYMRELEKDGEPIMIYPSSRLYMGCIVQVSSNVNYAPRTAMTIDEGAQLVARTIEISLSMIWRKETHNKMKVDGKEYVIIPSKFKFPIVKEVTETDILAEYLSSEIDKAVIDACQDKKKADIISQSPEPKDKGKVQNEFGGAFGMSDDNDDEDEDDEEEIGEDENKPDTASLENLIL
jgi:hypothetical protein